MSTYVYMRILESAPQRYDRGIRWLSLGAIDALYRSVADAAVDGTDAPQVLELGCGTGNLTLALLARGARVTAIDWNPDMLAIARQKLQTADGRVELREMAAVEIGDRFPAESFDAIASTLTFSEMSTDEQRYVLAAAAKILRPGGRLVIGDEVRARGLARRCLHALLRWPLAVITYLFTQTTTAAVADLAGLIAEAGFQVRREERTGLGSMAVVVAQKRAASSAPSRGGNA